MICAAADLSRWGDLADPGRRAALTAICVAAETALVRAPTGGIAQPAARATVTGHARLLDGRDDTVEHLAVDLHRANRDVPVIDTRVVHSNVNSHYGARRRRSNRAARLRVPLARHVVAEMHKVDAVAALLHVGRVDRSGPLLDASHRSLCDELGVSCTELDLALDSSSAAGGRGARMTGGGFEGSASVLVLADGAARITTAAGPAERVA